MRNENKNYINDVLNLVNQFLEGKIVTLDRNTRQHSGIFHYYTEIIRYWSRLNFVLHKTLRSLKLYKLPQKEIPIYIYTIYRKIQEKASKKKILDELNLSTDQNNNISKFIDKLKTFSWKLALKGKSKIEILSINEAIPTFIIDHLKPVMSFDAIKDNVRSMNDYYKYDNFIRISDINEKNFNQNAKDILKIKLKFNNIKMERDREIPELIYIPNDKKSLVLKSSAYASGKIIFQDKASVAVIKVLSPQPFEYIYDMCAAPGNKTNLIAQFTSNKARVIASEFLPQRTFEMNKLISKTNNFNIYLINCDAIEFPLRNKNIFDRILLDAPCTGSGTFLTNPELKWRQNKNFLYQNVTIQEKLISSALTLLKPNGIFVYSICSLYPEEGELQILKVIHNLEPLQLPKWFSSSYKINGKIFSGTGRTFPSLHHTHGFFIGKFKKKEK